jgi:hypothetical protein
MSLRCLLGSSAGALLAMGLAVRGAELSLGLQVQHEPQAVVDSSDGGNREGAGPSD